MHRIGRWKVVVPATTAVGGAVATAVYPSAAMMITSALLTCASIAAGVLRNANPKVVGSVALGACAVLGRDPGRAGELLVELNRHSDGPEPLAIAQSDVDQAHGQ